MVQDKVIVIDVQGFHVNKKLIAKEVSIAEIDSDSEIKTFMIKPPFNYSKLSDEDKVINKWLYYHLHGLRWDDGSCTLEEFEEYLRTIIKKEKNNNLILYAKGLEKVNWIKELIGGGGAVGCEEEINIYNLDDFNCPNIKTLYKYNTKINVYNEHYYSHHKDHRKYNDDNKKICAVKNVTLLRNFIINSIIN